MIRYLEIRNLAVIESVSVEFERSFNVLTGETGAGKSIVVEAVGLLLGGRASQELIRTGADAAVVDALFELDGAELSVRREITAQGRSRAFVDGALTTTAALKDLAGRLVEMHGQHEHQQLLDATQHLALLDAWAGLDSAREEVAEAFARIEALRRRLDRLRLDARERAARRELLEFQLSELTRASLRPGEDQELAVVRERLRHADTLRRLCAESYSDLYESEHAVLSNLARVWKRVEELAALDARFAVYADQRDSIKAQLEDLAFALRDYGDDIEAAPGRLEHVEERLALLERLKRKYGPTLEDVVARRDALSAELEELVGDTASASAVEGELHEASRVYLERARALSAARRAAGPRLAAALAGELADLAMERAAFDVRLTTHEEDAQWSPRGIDSGEFYLSANPGEELRPLARIVSGGELSRVMLALKTLAAAGGPEGKTLIFDEVDAGIGGRVAAAVGEKLRCLGDRYQVLCITHLPQIAAAAATHFAIEKRIVGARTLTSVRRLGPEERLEELARMIGGDAAASSALVTAREMLEQHAPGRKRKAKGERAAAEPGRRDRRRDA